MPPDPPGKPQSRRRAWRLQGSCKLFQRKRGAKRISACQIMGRLAIPYVPQEFGRQLWRANLQAIAARLISLAVPRQGMNAGRFPRAAPDNSALRGSPRRWEKVRRSCSAVEPGYRVVSILRICSAISSRGIGKYCPERQQSKNNQTGRNHHLTCHTTPLSLCCAGARAPCLRAVVRSWFESAQEH